MTTAELGLVTTAAVGIAAAVSPSLSAWANRNHERKMVKSTRRYERWREVFSDMASYLEKQRLTLNRVGQAMPLGIEPPDDPNDEELADLLGRVAVQGARDVEDALDRYVSAITSS